MKIYMSFWSKAYRDTPRQDLDLIKKITDFNVKNINNIYGKVHFVTDKIGKEIFKDTPWASIDLSLESVPVEYNEVWSLGKLYAYYHICNVTDHFLHLDYDFLILDKLPKYIEEADIVLQSKENTTKIDYRTEDFHKRCTKKYIATDFCPERTAYNCGIIGGKNMIFFREYSLSAITLVTDKANKDFWLKCNKSSGYSSFTKAVLAEQYYISLVLKHLNLSPTLVWDTYNYNPSDENLFKQANAIHLIDCAKSVFLKDIFNADSK